MIKAGIIGGAGYTAGELIRLLVFHPEVTIAYVQSSSQADKPVYSVHQDLLPHTELLFSEAPTTAVDVVFLCGGHGKSRGILDRWAIIHESVIIDLGSDFRLKHDNYKGLPDFVYGLPETGRVSKGVRSIANPGCFATAIELALLPFAHQNLVTDAVHIHAITGSTGAGQQPGPTTHFSWRNNNVSIYKPFGHQHLAEIEETLFTKQDSGKLFFLPVRGNFSRGIFCTAYFRAQPNVDYSAIMANFYASAPFVRITTESPSLKSVVNTNYCFLHVQVLEGQVLLTSVLDNLLKGASGQAVQNMNLVFGFPPTSGLQTKAIVF